MNIKASQFVYIELIHIGTGKESERARERKKVYKCIICWMDGWIHSVIANGRFFFLQLRFPVSLPERVPFSRFTRLTGERYNSVPHRGISQ